MAPMVLGADTTDADGSPPWGGSMPRPGRGGCISSPALSVVVESCAEADAPGSVVAGVRGRDAGVVIAGEELDEVIDPEEAIALKVCS